MRVVRTPCHQPIHEPSATQPEPNPVRTLCIGDIHGCYQALRTLVTKIPILEHDHIITLGDYVDRGPESPEVLDWLVERHAGGTLTALLGNHEELMLEARHSEDMLFKWLDCGGEDTIRAYGLKDPTPEALQQTVPAGHWTFMTRHCVPWHETASHIFVHANLHPHQSLPEQSTAVLRWMKFDRTPPHYSGKIMVCGHTPQPFGYPANFGHAICLDTKAYDPEGWLTCLDPATGRYWQANQQGKFHSLSFYPVMDERTAP